MKVTIEKAESKGNSLSNADVKMRKPSTRDYINAERAVGGDIDGDQIMFTVALVASTCTFDGKKYSPDELAELLSWEEVNELGEHLKSSAGRKGATGKQPYRSAATES